MSEVKTVRIDDYRADVVMLKDLFAFSNIDKDLLSSEFHVEVDDVEYNNIVFNLNQIDKVEMFSEYAVTFVKTLSDGKRIFMLRDF